MMSPYLRVVLFVYASARTASWPRYRLPDAGHHYAVTVVRQCWRGIYLTRDPMERRSHVAMATPYYLSVVVSSPDHALVAPSYADLLGYLKAGVAAGRVPGAWVSPF